MRVCNVYALITKNVVRWLLSFTVSALGQNCYYHADCTMSDSNSMCDFGNTEKCICATNYVEEFTVCKGKYTDPA